MKPNTLAAVFSSAVFVFLFTLLASSTSRATPCIINSDCPDDGDACTIEACVGGVCAFVACEVLSNDCYAFVCDTEANKCKRRRLKTNEKDGKCKTTKCGCDDD